MTAGSTSVSGIPPESRSRPTRPIARGASSGLRPGCRRSSHRLTTSSPCGSPRGWPSASARVAASSSATPRTRRRRAAALASTRRSRMASTSDGDSPGRRGAGPIPRCWTATRPSADRSSSTASDARPTRTGPVPEPLRMALADFGGRIAHAWLPAPAGAGTSTLDLLGAGLTLFTGRAGERWDAALAHLDHDVPVRVCRLDAVTARARHPRWWRAARAAGRKPGRAVARRSRRGGRTVCRDRIRHRAELRAPARRDGGLERARRPRRGFSRGRQCQLTRFQPGPPLPTGPARARRIVNPHQDDAVTFVQTSQESGGARTLLELELAPGGRYCGGRRAAMSWSATHRS